MMDIINNRPKPTGAVFHGAQDLPGGIYDVEMITLYNDQKFSYVLALPQGSPFADKLAEFLQGQDFSPTGHAICLDLRRGFTHELG